MRARLQARWLLLATLTACPSSKPSEGSPRAARDAEPPAATPDAPDVVRSTAQIRERGNRLKGQPSPYLEQHAHNPVEWYPWGEEALARARRENKPIFLSIGYSTCHWCHVMEKESFEDDEIAAFLNRHFVSIKVDREQRPDVDALYIEAVATLGASTGWPLTVFLTPELEPFFGGTYFPPRASGGRPGFLDVLAEVETMWREQGDAVASKGRAVLRQIEARTGDRVRGTGRVSAEMLDQAMAALARTRDTTRGGFGHRQKFPNAPLLLAQLRYVSRTNDAATRDHLVRTLEAMMAGGIRDHLHGSFHRYTVDPGWHVPHFEKTLYDNAQLCSIFIEAGLVLDRDDFVQIGRSIADDLVARWQGDDGSFVVGFDADDPAGEGVFYTWTPAELEAALGPPDARIVAAVFGVTDQGSPGMEGRSVLHRQDDDRIARELDVERSELQATVERSLVLLEEARRARPAPAVDDKAITGWNGLAIMALADAARWQGEPRWVRAAERAGDWILTARDRHGRVVRGTRQGAPLGEAVLEDRALAGLAFSRLHAATGDPKWLEAARQLVDEIVEHHYDRETAALSQTSREADDLPARLVDLKDGPMPSGGSAALLLLLELGALSGDPTLRSVADRIVERVASGARDRPNVSGYLLVALDHATARVHEVVVAGALDDPATRALWALTRPTNHARILPARIDAAGPSETLRATFPALQGKQALRGVPTAFVCERGRCQAPTASPAKLREQLAATRSAVPHE